tara:strand:- start:528 stop:1157 length:630 start_codon:yes stop_codon:yes gene_type:complete
MNKLAVCAFLMNADSQRNRLINFEHHYHGNYTRVSAIMSKKQNQYYPCLPHNSHHQYKALLATFLKTVNIALRNKQCSYAIIFEDDASPPPNLHKDIVNILKIYESVDVLYMDARNIQSNISQHMIPGCCTVANVYSKKALKFLAEAMNWKNSVMMKFYHLFRQNVQHHHCLSDWMLSNFLYLTNLNVASHPIIYGHGHFDSQVSINQQ